MTTTSVKKPNVPAVVVEGTVCLTEEFFAAVDATVRAAIKESLHDALAHAGLTASPAADRVDEASSPESPTAKGLDLPASEQRRASRTTPPPSLRLALQDGQGLIDSKTLARYLNVANRTLSRLISAGSVPAPVALGRGIKRWPVEEVLAWVFAGCPSGRQ